jgi:hypothetical protein
MRWRAAKIFNRFGAALPRKRGKWQAQPFYEGSERAR